MSQTSKIASANESYVFPTVGVDKNGNVGIVASALGGGGDPSIRIWHHSASAPANSVTGPQTVISGSQPYSCTGSTVS